MTTSQLRWYGVPEGEALEMADFHEGPVIIRFYKKWISILCPFGHSVGAIMLDKNWGGSAAEAKISNHQSGSIPWIVRCSGALPKPMPSGVVDKLMAGKITYCGGLAKYHKETP